MDVYVCSFPLAFPPNDFHPEVVHPILLLVVKQEYAALLASCLPASLSSLVLHGDTCEVKAMALASSKIMLKSCEMLLETGATGSGAFLLSAGALAVGAGCFHCSRLLPHPTPLYLPIS